MVRRTIKVNELLTQLDKEEYDAWDKRRNHAYIKGIRKAKKIVYAMAGIEEPKPIVAAEQ